MIALNEMFFYAISNWGEKTPKSTYETNGKKDWSVMNDSNLLIKDEGIKTYNSENSKATK